MRQAATALVGTHDFASFARAGGNPGRTTTRDLRRLSVRQMRNGFLVTVTATGFLRSMVRNIVGTLRDVGADRYGPRWMLTALESRERKQTDLTAPARGLCLMQVNYPQVLFLPA